MVQYVPVTTLFLLYDTYGTRRLVGVLGSLDSAEGLSSCQCVGSFVSLVGAHVSCTAAYSSSSGFIVYCARRPVAVAGHRSPMYSSITRFLVGHQTRAGVRLICDRVACLEQVLRTRTSCAACSAVSLRSLTPLVLRISLAKPATASSLLVFCRALLFITHSMHKARRPHP